MVIFHSYVSSPEGNMMELTNSLTKHFPPIREPFPKSYLSNRYHLLSGYHLQGCIPMTKHQLDILSHHLPPIFLVFPVITN